MALSVTSSAAAAITDASKAKAAANPIQPCIPLLPSLLVVPAHMQQEEHTLVPIRNLPCAAAAAAGPGKRGSTGHRAPAGGTSKAAAAPGKARRAIAAPERASPALGLRRSLFGGPQRARRPDRRCQLPGIDLLPGTGVIADEVAAAGTTVDLRILEAGWQDALAAERAGRHQ